MKLHIFRNRVAVSLKPIKRTVPSGEVLLKVIEGLQDKVELSPDQKKEVCSIIIDSIQ